jgi:hypothetical protein
MQVKGLQNDHTVKADLNCIQNFALLKKRCQAKYSSEASSMTAICPRFVGRFFCSSFIDGLFLSCQLQTACRSKHFFQAALLPYFGVCTKNYKHQGGSIARPSPPGQPGIRVRPTGV